MKKATEPSKTSLQGIASLFDDFERKELFKKYLFFLGWMEVFIFAACWIYHLGNGTPEQYGLVSLSFPWKAYFLVAFLAPGSDYLPAWRGHCRIQQVLLRTRATR